MGCILEFLLDFIGDGISELMCLILPKHRMGEVSKFILKTIIYLFTAVLLVSIIFGLIFLFSDDASLIDIGRKMIFIPLIILAVQITLGILIRIINKYR